MLTQSRLKELLHYDPETGVFTRLVTVSNAHKAGSVAGHRKKNAKRDGRPHSCDIKLDGKAYNAGRLAWLYMTGVLPDLVDHIDTDPFNNRWGNLRPATTSQNGANKKTYTSNKVGLKGVTQYGNRFRAQIRKDGKVRYIGLFKTPEEAAQAYRAEAERLHGAFARGF